MSYNFTEDFHLKDIDERLHYIIDKKIPEISESVNYIVKDEENMDESYVLKLIIISDEVSKNINKYINECEKISGKNVTITPVSLYLLQSETIIAQITPYYSELSLLNINTKEYFRNNRVMDLLNDLCECLKTFSDLNVIHGNIKPSNIMIEDGHYKLMDYCKYMITDPFALVKLTNYEYLSPEQYKNNNITIKTDMWNVGCIIYYIYTGTSPFSSSTSDTITSNVLNGNFKPIDYQEKNSMELNELLSHLFVINPDDRYTPQEMLDAIENMNGSMNINDNEENNHIEDEDDEGDGNEMSCYNEDHTKILLPCSNKLLPIPPIINYGSNVSDPHLVVPRKPKSMMVGLSAPQPSIAPPIPYKPKNLSQTVLNRRKSKEHVNDSPASSNSDPALTHHENVNPSSKPPENVNNTSLNESLYTLPSSAVASKPVDMHFIVKQLEDNRVINDLEIIKYISEDLNLIKSIASKYVELGNGFLSIFRSNTKRYNYLFLLMNVCLYNPQLRQVVVQALNCGLKSYEFKMIASIQQNAKINLWWSGFNSSTMLQTILHFPYIPCVRELNLSKCNIDDVDIIRSLSSSIRFFRDLMVLNLSDNNIKGDNIYYLCQAFSCFPQLRELDLKYCKLGPKGMVHLSDSFIFLKSLRKLNLAGNVIETNGMKYFCAKANNLASLCDLDISSNKLNASDISYFASCLVNTPNLVRLVLSKNKLSSDGATMLSRNIHLIPNLMSLDISETKITNPGLESLISSFRNLPVLQEFNISKNALNDSCCTCLGNDFKFMPNIVSLNLSGCAITSNGLKSITSCFHYIPRLQQLFFNHDYVNDESLKFFQVYLRDLPNLRHVDLSNNLFSLPVISELRDEYSHIPTFTYHTY